LFKDQTISDLMEAYDDAGQRILAKTKSKKWRVNEQMPKIFSGT
jgi:hypothetical protein